MMKLSLLAVLLVGCSGQGPGPGNQPDAPIVTDDGPGSSIGLPSWRLEDVRPQSPRVGDVYGLDSFNDKIVVVTLLEGF